MKKVLFTIIMLFMGTALFAQIPVTFQVDMGPMTWRGSFDPAADNVVIRGSFQTDAGDPGGDWQGGMFQLTDTDGDTIYTLDVNMPDAKAGTVYAYKFVKSVDQWEGDVGNGKADREFTLTGPSQVIPVVYFNNDSLYPTASVTNTIHFVADISGMLGAGAGGAFDPNQDSLLVLGLDWDGLGDNVQGDRKMVQDPFNPGIFTTTLSVTQTVSDSTKWKFRAFPGERFANTGWEEGNDNWYFFQADGHEETIEAVPRISPVLEPITADVTFFFRVDVSNAVNRYNNEPIDPNSVEFIGLRGGADWLGAWSSGNWTPSDTTTGNMKVLNDDGVNGDLTANDNIWSIMIVVPQGTTGGSFEYKYAAMYPGADTVNGGSSPLDNEGGFGTNHRVVLKDGGPFTITNDFGDFSPTSVRPIDGLTPSVYALEQNYPNPFNPSTLIRYSIPNEGLISVKVYNLVGELMGTIVNDFQNAGTYEVSFNAANLSSGVYFYTITAGDFKASKKMLLMK